jgi:hypothetical protein
MVGRFYELDSKDSSKYFWIQQKEIPRNCGYNSFESMIKKGKNDFKIYSGTTPSEIIGGDPVLNYYSIDFIYFLESQGIKLKKWPINIIIDDKNKNKIKESLPRFYFIEPVFFIDKLTDGNFLKKSDREEVIKMLNNWIRHKKTIYIQGDETMKTFYNLSNWDGADFFGVKNSKVIIITERLKKIIEKQKPKNMEFRELKILNLIGEI